MIALERQRTAAAIPAKFRGAGRAASELALLRLRREGEDADTKFWKAAKDQLRLEAGGKCGYCEASTEDVAFGDVEHFRPKSIYWWLAYCYENYVFSCQICNQDYKSDLFPVGAPRRPGPPVTAASSDAELAALAGDLAPDPLDETEVMQFQADCVLEDPHLPDPYATDPEPLFAWFADDVLEEVELRPRDDSPQAVRAHATAHTVLGLNRDELKRWRYRTYKPVLQFRTIYETPGLPPVAEAMARAGLLDAVAPQARFSAMSRFFVYEAWGLTP